MRNLDEPIHLSEYNPEWPIQFRAEAQRLSLRLPADLSIEHIGSTSVPGLVAKPIVDIMIGTEAHHDVEAIRSALVDLGYEDMGEAGVPGRIYLRLRSTSCFNIALVERGRSLWISNLAFRNHLQRSQRARDQYAQIKIEAVESGIRSLLRYSDFKKETVSCLMRRAMKSEQD